MSIIAVARRYAAPLADVAIEQNIVELIDSELRAFAEVMQSSDELYQLFASPVVPEPDKRAVLEAIIERMRPSTTTANLLRALFRNDRVQNVDTVYQEFKQEINERRGIVVAKVAVAAPVADSHSDSLALVLRDLAGMQVQLDIKVDPSLIGGVVTHLGSKVYDSSVKRQLEQISQRLKRGQTT